MVKAVKKNSIRIDLIINPTTEAVDIEVEHNFGVEPDEDMEGQITFYLDVINGLVHEIKTNMTGLASRGHLMKQASAFSSILNKMDLLGVQEAIDNFEDTLVTFEPDQELLDAIEEASNEDNVIEFKPKDRIH
tara:strand:+ start:2811 stop:3209 length:399 start_codon:yes stop_codon:yes gene_type:complete